MTYTLRLPARINLLGNPTDANEGDFAVISLAIDLYAQAEITPADGHEVIVRAGCAPDAPVIGAVNASNWGQTHAATPLLSFALAAINAFRWASPALQAGLAKGGFRLTLGSDVPPQSGLGGSSLFILLTLAALRAHYALDLTPYHNYFLAELAQRVEAQALGITCGYADRYVPLFGGLAYVDYRGKLQQRPLGEEPLATYERLDEWVGHVPLVVMSSGVPHDSGDVHGQMRPRYLAEQAAWEQNGGAPPRLVQLMQAAWETAWRGKLALLAHDWPAVGAWMNRNHALVDEMMRQCGLEDGAGRVNNQLIEAALAHGAYGAKLTGAGGGGSVVALVRPGEEAQLAQVWHQSAQAAGLTAAQTLVPGLDRHGLRVTPHPPSSPGFLLDAGR